MRRVLVREGRQPLGAEREALLRTLLANDDGTLPSRLAEEIEGIGIEAAAETYGRARDMTYSLYAAYMSWGCIGMAVRWLRSTDEPLTGIFAAFDDMHRGPTEVMTRYLVEESGDILAVSSDAVLNRFSHRSNEQR